MTSVELACDPTIRAAVLGSLTAAEEHAVESAISKRRHAEQVEEWRVAAQEEQSRRQVAVELHATHHGRRWTAQQLDVLRDPWLTSEECARILDRTKGAVKTARRFYQTGPSFNRQWTDSRRDHPERQRALRAYAEQLDARPAAVDRGPSAGDPYAWREEQ